MRGRAAWARGIAAAVGLTAAATTTTAASEKKKPKPPRYGVVSSPPSFTKRFSGSSGSGMGIPGFPQGGIVSAAATPAAHPQQQSPQSIPVVSGSGGGGGGAGLTAWQRAALRVAKSNAGEAAAAAAAAVPAASRAKSAWQRAAVKAIDPDAAAAASSTGTDLVAQPIGADGAPIKPRVSSFAGAWGSVLGASRSSGTGNGNGGGKIFGIADIVLAKARETPASNGESWKMLKEQSNIFRLGRAFGVGSVPGKLSLSGRGDPRFVGHVDDIFRPFDSDAEAQFIGSAMVLALMHAARVETPEAVASKQRDAALFFREHCVLSHDFDALVGYFRVLLSRHNMAVGDWRQRAQLWRLVFLQDVRGFWSPGAGLAQALHAVKLREGDLKKFLSGDTGYAREKEKQPLDNNNNSRGDMPTVCPLSGGDPEAFAWSIPASLSECARKSGGRVDAGRVWATALSLAAVEALDECWADHSGLTVADKGFFWLEDQALAYLDFAIIMGQVVREAKGTVAMWADYNVRTPAPSLQTPSFNHHHPPRTSRLSPPESDFAF